MKFCPTCGAQLEDDAKFCPTCGAQIAQGQPAQTTAQPAAPAVPRPSFVMGLLGLLFCEFGILGLIFSAIGLGQVKKYVAAGGTVSGQVKVLKILSTIGLIFSILYVAGYVIGAIVYIIMLVVGAAGGIFSGIANELDLVVRAGMFFC